MGVALPVGGGGGGGVQCWMGVWASRWVSWLLCVRVVRSSRSLAGRGVQVGGVCLGIRGGMWSIGSRWLLVGGAR